MGIIRVVVFPGQIGTRSLEMCMDIIRVFLRRGHTDIHIETVAVTVILLLDSGRSARRFGSMYAQRLGQESRTSCSRSA